jgi:hypothetical protein
MFRDRSNPGYGGMADNPAAAANDLTQLRVLAHPLRLRMVSPAATAFFNPAMTGLLPDMLSRERLQQANALRGTVPGAGPPPSSPAATGSRPPAMPLRPRPACASVPTWPSPASTGA